MEGLLVVLRVVSAVVVLDVALAWLLPGHTFPRTVIRQLTAPLYQPVQRVFDPAKTGVDFSPMVIVMLVITLAYLIAPEAVAGG